MAILQILGTYFSRAESDPPQLIRKIGGPIEGGWRPEGDALRWRIPNKRGQTRYDALWRRHAIKRAVRSYFDEQSFVEIDAPLLVQGTTPDAAIKSFRVEDRYLVTSTEYQIKRLGAGGFDRVYTLTQNFRRPDGDGPLRNQEFTMLEWARVACGLDAIERDAEQLIWRAHRELDGRGTSTFQGYDVDLAPPFERLTVAHALTRTFGVPLPDFSASSLRRAAQTAGIGLCESWWEDCHVMFSLLMNHIGPSLGLAKPIFLRDWPSFETSSAQERSSGITDRSELFIAGLEVGDGFTSLTSHARQLQTFEYQNARRRMTGAPEVSWDTNYLAAMAEGLPAGAGMAIGFDRLVMLLSDRASIREVLAFAWNEL